MVRRLFTPGWLALHVVAVAAVVVCVEAGRWQLHRAQDSGRVLNWSYAFEWWLFAAFAVFLWAKEMVDTLEGRSEATVLPVDDTPSVPVVVDTFDDDPELAAYNRRLAELHARDQAQR